MIERQPDLREELREAYLDLHALRCGDLGYYAPITECPHPSCTKARRILALPKQPLDDTFGVGLR